MPDSNAPQRKKRSRFSDIFSILGGESPAPPEPEPVEEEPIVEVPDLEPPAQEQPVPEPAPEPEPVTVKEPEPVLETIQPEPEPIVVKEPEPEPVAEAAEPEPAAAIVPEPVPEAAPPQVAAAVPPDPAIVDRLLADFAEKNGEILRLNNELSLLRFELKEKDQQIAILEAAEAELKKALEDQITSKQALGQEKDAMLAAKDEDLRARDEKIRDMEARMRVMSEQFGVLRKFATRESTHEPFEEPAATPEETPQADAPDEREPTPAGEEDVASIFMRLAGAKQDQPEGEESGGDSERPPRKPRSAKLYDL